MEVDLAVLMRRLVRLPMATVSLDRTTASSVNFSDTVMEPSGLL
ncbi:MULTISPECIES: hypothetical protein [Ferrimicrobium]|nr:hypothetical protein [Ferrimicrobium sp.]